MTAEPQRSKEDVHTELIDQGFTCTGSLPPLGWFGDSPELARQLGELVRQGRKTATAGLLWSWEEEDEGLPAVGQQEVIIDWAGKPLAVIEFTEVTVVPFLRVDAEFARDEGEGDGSLAFWRAAHRSFFARECARLGRQQTDDPPVVCMRFRVVHAAPDAAAAQ